MKRKKKKGKVRIGLGLKFSFFVAMLITFILVIITIFIYNQQKQTLTNEVKQRGIAIAINLANNAVDGLLPYQDLYLFTLTKQVIQEPLFEEYASKDNLFHEIIKIIKEEFLEKKEKKEIKNEGILNAVILFKDGRVAAASGIDKYKAYETYTNPPGVKPLGNNKLLIQEYSYKGREYFDIGVAIIYNKKKLGEVHLKVSQYLIHRTILASAIKLILIILASLILGIVFSVLLVNFMIKPIHQLVKGVRAIGEGNYDVQLKIKTRDELGELTEVFNNTARSLKEKELLKGAFSTYVSSSVMEEILKDPTKLKLHGKRIKTTILFTDIRGFTAMSENLEPEQVVSVINEYLTLQTDKIFKWEGLLDKFVGDCVMAVFGLPFPKEDDAYRAVRAAMDIRDGIDRLNAIRKRRNEITVGIGIGVNTGEVVAGNMGSPQKMDYTVIGDNVNLASRLESNAPAGMIWVSETTYNETKDRIEYKEHEPIKVKGKKVPVKVYEPIKLKEP